MATLTVRKLEESTKRTLRLRAARNGHSLEQEVRTILTRVAQEEEGGKSPRNENLYDSIRHLVDRYGPFDLELPPRGSMREPPTFD